MGTWSGVPGTERGRVEGRETEFVLIWGYWMLGLVCSRENVNQAVGETEDGGEGWGRGCARKGQGVPDSPGWGWSVCVMVWVVCARGVCGADRQRLTALRPLLQRAGGSSWTDKEGPCRWASASNIVLHLRAGKSMYFLKG